MAKSKSTYDIIQGISQAAANAFDGALDEVGEPLKVGLKREDGIPLLDKRVIDGFKVSFHGPQLCIKYQSEIGIKEVHDKNRFESDIEGTISDVAKFLKKEYKKLTGNALTLTAGDAPKIVVQNLSRSRTWVQAHRFFKIGGLNEVEDLRQPSEDRLDASVKKWLGLNGNKKRATGTGYIGSDTFPGVKKANNVKGKRDLEPRE